MRSLFSTLKTPGVWRMIDSARRQPARHGAVSERLNARWTGARAHYIAGFCDYNGLLKYVNEGLRIVEPTSDGVHDFCWITAVQMVTDPSTVRYEERVAAGKAMVNGVSIADLDKTVEVGEKLMQWRVGKTVALIRESIGPARLPGTIESRRRLTALVGFFGARRELALYGDRTEREDAEN